MTGKAEIDRVRCKGCGLCIEVCPQKALGLSKEANQKGYYPAEQIDGANCIGCAMCAQMCPDVAIRVWREVR